MSTALSVVPAARVKSLDEIAAAIDGAHSRDELLRQHREALVAKRGRLDAMLAAVDAALVALQKGNAMQPDDVKQILRATASRMPGFEDFEVGAGYINAYAAVDEVFNRSKPYGQTFSHTFAAAGSVPYHCSIHPFMKGTVTVN